MYLHLACYGESVGQVTNSDINAIADGLIVTRNSHLIFTEPFSLAAVYGSSTTLTRARFGNAGLQQRGIPHIWPLGRTDTVPSRPRIMDMTDRPLTLPQNEELTIEATTDAVGPVAANFVLWLVKPDWHRNFPAHLERLSVRATVVIVAGSETTWTAEAEPTFERDPLNGVYAVVGAQLIAANAIAFRLRFPDQLPVDGKQLRPGTLVTNAVGEFPHEYDQGGWGEWGRFHTFSPPTVQVFADAAGGTYELRLDLLYLGTDKSLLYQIR